MKKIFLLIASTVTSIVSAQGTEIRVRGVATDSLYTVLRKINDADSLTIKNLGLPNTDVIITNLDNDISSESSETGSRISKSGFSTIHN